jgi:hypothetical protein
MIDDIVMGDHAVLIQTQWRRKSEQDSYQMLLVQNKHKNAAISLQKQVRKRATRHVLDEKRQERKLQMEMQSTSALRIQAMTRGKNERKRYINGKKQRISSAEKMQSVYRGHLSRRLLTIYVVAATRIQRFWKFVLVRRRWVSLRVDIRSVLRAERLFRLDATTRRVTSPKRGQVVELHEKPTDRDGNDAMMLAARAGSRRIVRLCLGAGYSTSSVNGSDKQTALHLAASAGAGRAEIGKMLIQAGADITATDSLGRSVCHVAAASGDEKLLKMLLKMLKLQQKTKR